MLGYQSGSLCASYICVGFSSYTFFFLERQKRLAEILFWENPPKRKLFRYRISPIIGRPNRPQKKNTIGDPFCPIRHFLIFFCLKYLKIPQVIIRTIEQKNPMTQSAEQVFHSEADTFDIIVTFNNEKLTIQLKDFTEWVIYSREYTEDDIGKEIHRKMDLSDVMNAFYQARSYEEITQVGAYEFGTPVLKSGDPFYKIQKGGKVSAFLVIIDKKLKKQLVYESKLTLNKVRDLTKQQIKEEKMLVQEKMALQQMVKRVQVIQMEKTGLYDQISALNSKVAQLTAINSAQNKLLQVYRLHNFPQYNSKTFKADGLRVQCLGSSEMTQYMFNHKIQQNQTYKFSIKAIKLKRNNMLVGVVDYQKQKYQKTSFYEGNAMCYYSFNGTKYPKEGIEGLGFKEGDTVVIDVNRAQNTIKYFINGKLRATHTNEMLSDAGRVFVPFVEMKNANDVIEWITL